VDINALIISFSGPVERGTFRLLFRKPSVRFKAGMRRAWASASEYVGNVRIFCLPFSRNRTP
jgi:hypothetical protein